MPSVFLYFATVLLATFMFFMESILDMSSSENAHWGRFVVNYLPYH